MFSPIVVSKALPSNRLRDLGILAALVGWLVYTRVYWALHAAHLGFPPCPFYYITGHPCPFCSGTRSFLCMWQGDLSDAVRLYPLGPALFAGALLSVGGLTSALITGRTWFFNLTSLQWKVLTIG